MNNQDPLTVNVTKIVAGLAGNSRVRLTPDTKLLSELDLDSLKMIELTDKLKLTYGVDFYAPPLTIEDLYSVKTIVAALRAHGVNHENHPATEDVLEDVG